ncbi:hypothetical protein PENNAL_c0089G07716 [Penicillium nalgiovense]|uniref:Uncharacterized protein n=1 Tax=Penicillium nalgiovense TaxID=60175 RepID=A0A1V6XDU0_PENNA|nr:hypothetical protein PENNAL_c0089G07716 [Penicillium nalgiovense]
MPRIKPVVFPVTFLSTKQYVLSKVCAFWASALPIITITTGVPSPPSSGGDAAAVTAPKVPRVERLLEVLRRCSAGSLRLAMKTIASSVQYDQGSWERYLDNLSSPHA